MTIQRVKATFPDLFSNEERAAIHTLVCSQTYILPFYAVLHVGALPTVDCNYNVFPS
jgi:hypothetical protein